MSGRTRVLRASACAGDRFDLRWQIVDGSLLGAPLESVSPVAAQPLKFGGIIDFSLCTSITGPRVMVKQYSGDGSDPEAHAQFLCGEVSPTPGLKTLQGSSSLKWASISEGT